MAYYKNTLNYVNIFKDRPKKLDLKEFWRIYFEYYHY